MFNLPIDFKLKRKKWTVELTSDKMEHPDYPNHNIRGLCSKEDRLIEIDEKQSQYNILKTFWHEYLHAIEYEYGLKIPHKLIYALEAPLTAMVVLLIKLNTPQRRERK